MRSRLTPNQFSQTLKQKIIMENTIIQASAGTGKTHQLACRYLLLLFSGVRPESILA
ncbi:MAG: UvrD-helicase domain-containing protein, partial [Thermoguttaceae bacterium]|nr:UvrD-helicase domain-containing protein [Thermoguttaceae bacterium]